MSQWLSLLYCLPRVWLCTFCVYGQPDWVWCVWRTETVGLVQVRKSDAPQQQVQKCGTALPAATTLSQLLMRAALNELPRRLVQVETRPRFCSLSCIQLQCRSRVFTVSFDRWCVCVIVCREFEKWYARAVNKMADIVIILTDLYVWCRIKWMNLYGNLVQLHVM